MRGHIARKRNRYYVVVDIGIHSEIGRRRQKWYPAGTTRRQAERKQIEVLAELNKGTTPVEPSRMRLGKYLEQWMRSQANVRVRTAEGYRQVVRTISYQIWAGYRWRSLHRSTSRIIRRTR